jgi:hypothetical protein
MSLSDLIQRVHDDETRNYATKEHLVDLAAFILTWPGKYTREEYDQAIQILASYHLGHLPTQRHGWKLIEKELARPYQARCQRCGLLISNTVSLQTGHGPVCRRKLGISGSQAKESVAVMPCGKSEV